MKPKFSHFLGLTFLLMTLVFLSVSAQEGGIPNNEIPDLNFHPELQEEKPLLFEPDRSVNNNERTTQSRDQFIVAPKSSKSKTGDTSKGNAATAKTEDDALSFNFLYYIIQKFKISDIVEQ